MLQPGVLCFRLPEWELAASDGFASPWLLAHMRSLSGVSIIPGPMAIDPHLADYLAGNRRAPSLTTCWLQAAGARLHPAK
jgi:hypothetical protein